MNSFSETLRKLSNYRNGTNSAVTILSFSTKFSFRGSTFRKGPSY